MHSSRAVQSLFKKIWNPNGCASNSALTDTRSFSAAAPLIEAPIRFEGKWERFQGVGNPKYPFTRFDVLMAGRRIEHEYRQSQQPPWKYATYSVDIAVEKRGKMAPEASKYLTSLRRELGDRLQGLHLQIPETAVRQLLELDGVKKEIIEIGPSETSAVSGAIGMKEGYLFIKLVEGDQRYSTFLEPNQVTMFLSLARYAALSSVLKYPKRMWIPKPRVELSSPNV